MHCNSGSSLEGLVPGRIRGESQPDHRCCPRRLKCAGMSRGGVVLAPAPIALPNLAVRLSLLVSAFNPATATRIDVGIEAAVTWEHVLQCLRAVHPKS
jgi:hypothetical protein